MLFGVVLSFVVAFAAVAAFTQTEWGRSRIIAFTVRAIGGRLSGVLSIGHVEGNLLSGARVHDVALRGYDGVPLARLDSAYIQYRVVSFLGGDIVINRLVVWNAAIDVTRMPEDSLWNYEEILTDPNPDPNGRPIGILIERLILNNSLVTIQSPVSGDSRRSPEGQRAEVAAMIADSAHLFIHEVPGGFTRSMFLDIDSLSTAEVFIGGSERGGIYLEARDAHAAFRNSGDPPLEVRAARGQLHVLDGLISVELPSFTLAGGSDGSMVGTIDMNASRPMYDLSIDADRFALSDLRWLFPWFPAEPEEASGSGHFILRDEEDKQYFLARDFVLEMPESRVTGEFGLVMGVDSIGFTDVNLDADPLKVEDVKRLLPEGLPVTGLEIGSAMIE